MAVEVTFLSRNPDPDPALLGFVAFVAFNGALFLLELERNSFLEIPLVFSFKSMLNSNCSTGVKVFAFLDVDLLVDWPARWAALDLHSRI